MRQEGGHSRQDEQQAQRLRGGMEFVIHPDVGESGEGEWCGVGKCVVCGVGVWYVVCVYVWCVVCVSVWCVVWVSVWCG